MDKSLSKFIASLKESKAISVIILFVILAAIPLTVLIAQKQQEIRQRASGPEITPTMAIPYKVDIFFSKKDSVNDVVSTVNLTPGEALDLDLHLSVPPEVMVNAFDIKVNYLNSLSFVSGVEHASQFQSVIPLGAAGLGTLQIAKVNTSSGAYGKIRVATLSLKAKPEAIVGSNGTISISQALITSQNYRQDYIPYNALAVNYTIIAATPSVTPTIPDDIISITPTRYITPTSTPTINPPTPTTRIRPDGDINGDGNIDIIDYEGWRNRYTTTKQDGSGCPTNQVNGVVCADLNGNGSVDLLDFNIWFIAFNASFGSTPTPSIMPSKTPTPTPPAAAAKRVFVTSTTYNGNLGGLSGADAKCQTRANAASLGGTWKAWLGDKVDGPSTRFIRANTFYKLLDGTTIANDWNDLVDGALQHAINLDESGTSGIDRKVWTNTAYHGGRWGSNDQTDTCGDWQQTNGTGITGSSANINMSWTWTGGSGSLCTSQYSLYCFEQ